MIFKDGAKITGEFLEKGSWRNGYHMGLDIVPKGDDFRVYSPHEFTVLIVNMSNDSALGNYVLLWDPVNFIVLRFCHMDTITVLEGEHISKGDYIGTMGGTNSTNKPYPPHIHINYFPATSNGDRSMILDSNHPYYKNVRGYGDPKPILKLMGAI